MNFLQSIFDFLLSFLKLSPTRLLIGSLIISLVASLWVLREQSIKHTNERIEWNKEKDTLRTIIVNDNVNAAKREMQMMKECYEDKEKLSKILDKEIKEAKK